VEEVTKYDAQAWRRVHDLAIMPWAGGEKDYWMRLVPERITGRYVGPRL
jgi:hypothetical protein